MNVNEAHGGLISELTAYELATIHAVSGIISRTDISFEDMDAGNSYNRLEFITELARNVANATIKDLRATGGYVPPMPT